MGIYMLEDAVAEWHGDLFVLEQHMSLFMLRTLFSSIVNVKILIATA